MEVLILSGIDLQVLNDISGVQLRGNPTGHRLPFWTTRQGGPKGSAPSVFTYLRHFSDIAVWQYMFHHTVVFARISPKDWG